MVPKQQTQQVQLFDQGNQKRRILDPVSCVINHYPWVMRQGIGVGILETLLFHKNILISHPTRKLVLGNELRWS